MTPNELLELVKKRFTILLHDDPDSLNSALTQAIGKYQDLAGFMKRVRITDASKLTNDNQFALPPLFMTRVVVKDNAGRYIRSDVWDDQLELGLDGSEQYPIVVTYLENAQGGDFDQYQLPASTTSLIADYLYLLIEGPNNERKRRIAMAGKLDTSDIATEADVATRKATWKKR